MTDSDPGPVPPGNALWPSRAPRRRRSVVWPLLLLFVVGAVAVITWRLEGRGPVTFTDLVDLAPPPYTPVDVSGFGNPGLGTIFNLGMVHFTEADWPAACEQLARADRMLRADPRGGPAGQPLFAPMLRMYLGVALLENGRAQEALAALEELTAPDVMVALRERGIWYSAQARLLLGDGQGALEALDALTGSPVYGQSAPALAARVRERLKR